MSTEFAQMRRPSILAVALISTIVIAGGPPPASTSAPLRPTADCLEPDQVRNWGVVDQRRLVVETLGQRYYDIQLTSDCSDLLTRPYISFRDGATMGADDERICGDINDAVVPRGGTMAAPACDIARIRRIDKPTFDGVFGQPPDVGNALLDAAPEAPAEPTEASPD